MDDSGNIYELEEMKKNMQAHGTDDLEKLNEKLEEDKKRFEDQLKQTEAETRMRERLGE